MVKCGEGSIKHVFAACIPFACLCGIDVNHLGFELREGMVNGKWSNGNLVMEVSLRREERPSKHAWRLALDQGKKDDTCGRRGNNVVCSGGHATESRRMAFG